MRLQWSQGRIQRAKARVTVVVGAAQAGSGSIASRTRTQRATASCASAKTPRATPPRSAAPKAEPSSTAVRSSGRASTDATIRSHSVAARAAARDAPDARARRRARGGARASRAARTRRPRARARDERAAIVPKRRAGEGAACVRVGVRRAFAREVRQEQQPLGARLPARRLGDRARRTCAGASTSRNQASDPRRRASRPSPATCRGRRGRTRERAPRGSARVARAAPRRRRRTCRARPRRGPARSIPTPSAAAGLVARARRPRVDSSAGGSHSQRDLERRAAPPPLQRRWATSKSSVPDASAASIAHSPVSRRRT